MRVLELSVDELNALGITTAAQAVEVWLEKGVERWLTETGRPTLPGQSVYARFPEAVAVGWHGGAEVILSHTLGRAMSEATVTFMTALVLAARVGMRTPPLIVEQRLKLCGACEFLDTNKHCLVCTCSVAAKAQFSVSACPRGKW